MGQLNLGLAIHNHQPVGNYPFVFEQVYHDAYLPFLEALERHPDVRISLHISGCLLDWLLPNRPEYIRQLAALRRADLQAQGADAKHENDEKMKVYALLSRASTLTL